MLGESRGVMDDQALISSESLDRASPELWPEQSTPPPLFLYFRNIPGVSEFISTRQPDLNIQTPAKYTTDLDKEDLELIHDYPRKVRPERRTVLVARELAQYKVDIAALSETKFSVQGQLELCNGYTFWCGRPKAE
ncbi:unnamed protein product [Schistocephalus solidus]|uniref:Endo/exonuclease/phosphatase domain-containing protein n=1 Tax=Schistocephalus solidus TaxID=70667 RepID=A0A183T489_SCHSO|nr:unnamed protein product [Schistocephalus solidus]